jgi:pyrroline-5-carboxylate reductase
MASALARGWGDPVLVSDPASDRAQALVSELGGEAFVGNVALAEAADLVVLCHKPAQLAEVAAEIAAVGTPVVSILGSVTLAAVREAYGQTPAFRVLPNLPVEVARGVLCWPSSNGEAAPAAEIKQEFSRLGKVVEIDETQMEAAMAVSSNAPAFIALLIESLVDAGVRHGLASGVAHELAVETLAGTAALLERREGDTLGVRRAVTSPGGSTARGLAALERHGLRSAVDAAVEAVLEGGGK